MVPTRADRCCYVLYSINWREQTWNKGDSSQCKTKWSDRIEPARQEEGPRNAGLDPVSMRMSPLYSEPICGGTDPQPLAFKRLNEHSSGAKRSQYQIPRPVAKDEERLTRKKGDMPPPLPRKIDNPRLREDPALMEFYSNTDKIHTPPLGMLMHMHGSITVSIFSRSEWRKHVETMHSFTCQRISAVFSSTIWAHLIGRVNSDNHRIWAILLPKMKGTMSPICRFFVSFGETINYAHVILTAEADSLPTDARQLLKDYGLVECHSNKGNYLSAHARIDSTGHVRRLLWESNDEEDTGSHATILEVKFGQRSEGSNTDLRERTADTLFSDLESVALVIVGNDTKSNQIPTAHCLRDLRDRQLLTIRSSKDTLLCMPYSPWTSNERARFYSKDLQKGPSTRKQFQCRCHCWRCQCGSKQIPQESEVSRPV